MEKSNDLKKLETHELISISAGSPSAETGFWYDVAYLTNLMLYAPMPGWILINPY